MDYSTCVLKVNLHCTACERTIHKVLRNINGVCSITIDGEHGKVTVSGTVDPHTLILALRKAGKKAKLLWEHYSTYNCQNKSLQASPPGPAQEIDAQVSSQMEQLRQLSKINGVKQVELTHSKIIKMTFEDQNDDFGQKSNTQNTMIIVDDVHGPRTVHGGGPSGVAASGCDCHDQAKTNSHYGFHEVAGPSRPRCVHHENSNGCGLPSACRCSPPGPLPAHYHVATGPSLHLLPVAYSHPSIFSDDNPQSCKLM
ncbi:unnamed protein product [Ilex paraguariensis]|uniref:HMA domain-containing protein n=1 Tax=Ilex paraguariensis TaxID=185542 RepID=A0ABC8U251_9AQUA